MPRVESRDRHSDGDLKTIGGKLDKAFFIFCQMFAAVEMVALYSSWQEKPEKSICNR